VGARTEIVLAMTTPSTAQQLAGFIDKFDPAIAKLTRSARAVLRKRLPTAVELVYDNYNALAIVGSLRQTWPLLSRRWRAGR